MRYREITEEWDEFTRHVPVPDGQDWIAFDDVVYHCSTKRFDSFRVASKRGVYFANEPDTDYGMFVYRCRVRLNRAKVDLSTDNFEIDRESLIAQGYDGRILDYGPEWEKVSYDVIAFHDNQIEILEVEDRTK